MRVLITDHGFPNLQHEQTVFAAADIQLDVAQCKTAEDVIAAGQDADALERLTEEAGAFDLMLTDIRMPMMDGIALALAAKRDFPDLPILLMTGYADQRERAKNLEVIIEDVLTKPFSLGEARSAVLRVLEARRNAA